MCNKRTISHVPVTLPLRALSFHDVALLEDLLDDLLLLARAELGLQRLVACAVENALRALAVEESAAYSFPYFI